ncbi:MAG: hypothetical protein AB8F95_05525 [Bacteroidia bacterium]
MKQLLICLILTLGTLSFAQNIEVYVSNAGNFNNPPWQILKLTRWKTCYRN